MHGVSGVTHSAGLPGSVQPAQSVGVVPKFRCARFFAAAIAVVVFPPAVSELPAASAAGVSRVLRLTAGVPGESELDDDRRQPDEDDRHEDDRDDGGRSGLPRGATEKPDPQADWHHDQP
jgi:hypothetical protein